MQAFLSSVIKFAVKGVFLSFSCFFFLGADLVSTYYVSVSNKVFQVNRRGFVWLTIFLASKSTQLYNSCASKLSVKVLLLLFSQTFHGSWLF